MTEMIIFMYTIFTYQGRRNNFQSGGASSLGLVIISEFCLFVYATASFSKVLE